MFVRVSVPCEETSTTLMKRTPLSSRKLLVYHNQHAMGSWFNSPVCLLKGHSHAVYCNTISGCFAPQINALDKKILILRFSDFLHAFGATALLFGTDIRPRPWAGPKIRPLVRNKFAGRKIAQKKWILITRLSDSPRWPLLVKWL